MAKTEIAIIGGGAAGFFTAVNVAEKRPDSSITIYEASNKLLAKVLVSGGGRCNVTNRISEPTELIRNYPRGEEFLLPAFNQFTSSDTVNWFESRGVPIKFEEDGRAFPASNSSETIYNCLTNLVKKNGVAVKTHHRLIGIKKIGLNYELAFENKSITAQIVVLATGSNNLIFKMLEPFNISIVSPVPSLFTFNAQNHLQKELAGVSVSNAAVSIKEVADSEQIGPLLITHWGYSGPSILRLSAWQARTLNQLNYHFNLVINWLPQFSGATLTNLFLEQVQNAPKEKVTSWNKQQLPKRLWSFLIEEAQIKDYTNWSEIGKKGIARLVDKLTNYQVYINKKSTFKDEFVTAGGIDLREINEHTFELKKHPNLYAAGEILNIDAITGGFNFQAAWSGANLISEDITN